MKIHELTVPAAPTRKRVGRGISAGQGKTAGRGTKGQNSRTGGGVRIGFEGGQNPLAKRLPKKRGFTAPNHQSFQVINLNDLGRFKTTEIIDITALRNTGLVGSLRRPVKLLAGGEVTTKVTVQVQAASAAAKAAVEQAGGKLEIVALPKVVRPDQERAA